MIGKKLKEILEKKRISNVEIAKNIGISDATISNWTNNKKTSGIENFIKLCNYLEIELHDLQENAPPNKEDPPDLQDNEQLLIDTYRNMDQNQKKLLFEVAKCILFVYNNKSADKHGRD